VHFTRRTTLLATGAAFGLAGCVDEIPAGNEENDTDTRNDSDPGDDVEYDVFQLGPSPSRPWWTTNEDETGFVTLLASQRDRPWMVGNPEEVEGLESWLDETDFDGSAIVYIETGAPDACYTELDVSNVAVKDGTIVGTAEAVDTKGNDEACNQVETYPSAFVRETVDAVPAEATFTVIDGWGESSEVAADGRYIDPEGLPGHVQPSVDPRKLEEFTCDTEGFERHWAPEEVALGEAHNDDELPFAMGLHGTQALAAGDEGSPTVGRGHEVRITMRNVSTDYQYTGNRHKYNLQVLPMDGWQDVRGTTDGPLGYTDEAIEHRPGEGFEWTFEMTEVGVVEDGHPHEDTLEVYPELRPGRYRFVYYDAGGEPLAVEFEYSE
jgi:hypothetical protein